MTNKTTIKIKIPTQYLGKLVKGSMEKVLTGSGTSLNPSSSPPATVSTVTPARIPNPEQYIILPGKSHGSYSYPDTLLSIERQYKGKNWFDSHKALSDTGFYMPTLRQFVDFLALLRSGTVRDGNAQSLPPRRVSELFEDITAVRDPYRGEWLDADFKESPGGLMMNYGHRIDAQGKLVQQYTQPVTPCLMQDKNPGIDLVDWIAKATATGLPPSDVKSGTVWYWFPRSDNMSVARFNANSGRAGLYCDGDPADTDARLGVRAAREKK